MSVIKRFIENLILLRFIMLKSKFGVKRNLLKKAFDYSRGNRRFNREFISQSFRTISYSLIRKVHYKTKLFHKKAYIWRFLTPYECYALLINDQK